MQGTATGMLVGGTLTQLMASLGTPWAFDPPHGCVLFLEDIGERPYRIHRMLTQVAQAGIFANARGDRVRRVSRLRRARRRSGDSRRAARLHRGVPRPGAVQLSLGPHHRADVDAAVRRQGRSRQRAVAGGAHPGSGGRVTDWHRRDSSDWRVRHGDGDAGRAAEASRPRRQRIGRARLSADERLSRGRAASPCSRAIAPSTSPRRSIWSSSAMPSRAATRSSRPCSIAASATRRCRRRSAISCSGTRSRS